MKKDLILFGLLALYMQGLLSISLVYINKVCRRQTLINESYLFQLKSMSPIAVQLEALSGR